MTTYIFSKWIDLFFYDFINLFIITRNNKFTMNLEDNKCEFYLIIEDVPKYCHALYTFGAFVHSVLELEIVFSIALRV